MPPHPMTVEALWALPRVGSPCPSPDGSKFVVPVTTFSFETNEGTTRLWLVSSDGATVRVLTMEEASSAQPALSPDGARLAFIRKPGGEKNTGKAKERSAGRPAHTDHGQLYVMSLHGGEPERLTDMPLGAADPRWFPDGKRIAFLAPVFRDAPGIAATSERAKAMEEAQVKAYATEDRIYRYWDRWLTDGRVHHVFAVDLGTREVMDLTPASKGWFPLMDPSGHYDIAPDGREIVLTVCRSLPPYDPVLFGAYTVEVPEKIAAGSPAGDVRLLTVDQTGDAHKPTYSPDGRLILYGIQREMDFYADKVRLVSYDRRTGKHVVLTEEWDRSAEEWSFGDDPATLFLTAETEGHMSLFALDVAKAASDPAANAPKPLARGGWFGEPHPAGGRIFATLESLTQPPEVHFCRLDGRDLRRVTDFTKAALSEIALGEVEEVTFPGAEGRSVQMFLVRPSQAAASTSPDSSGAASRKAPPLVHVIHGGPHGASGDQWHWRWNAQAFAAAGYLVASVNFHGSTGWGQEFTASILGRWGDQPYRDIMAATDWLIAKGLVDPSRMAATGGSYGGYLACWIASQTDRFACIVNHAGVADFQSEYSSDVTQGRRRSMGGEPWENIEGMDRYNPLRQAKGFKSPMLVIHGERDYRVPYNQALEIYNVYKAMGLTARLVCYPDENHWILKPANSRHWYGEVLGWLDRWLNSR